MLGVTHGHPPPRAKPTRLAVLCDSSEQVRVQSTMPCIHTLHYTHSLTHLSNSPLAAVALALALNSLSDFKHKSWYVHLLVWIVPRQIVKHGDLWRFSTVATESRGARLKRMPLCWRPYQEGLSVYHYIDHKTNKEVCRYCPLLQYCRLPTCRTTAPCVPPPHTTAHYTTPSPPERTAHALVAHYTHHTHTRRPPTGEAGAVIQVIPDGADVDQDNCGPECMARGQRVRAPGTSAPAAATAPHPLEVRFRFAR